ncbi:hypothetical protein [Pseudomonas sp. Pseusp97]|uniref:hypothetical protein n=1 Tax=Pseudomonas sp. Pseusp97 TaxID=3243065 RepID=UPI0039A4DF19
MSKTLTLHYLAFIDILGFSEMVEMDCSAPPDADTFNLNKLYETHSTTKKALGELEGYSLTQFSDSIVLSRSFSHNIDDLRQFLSIVAKYQADLLSSGLLCRGGISFGKHCEDSSFLFSKALINAYSIEAKTAKYPRIVVDQNLLQLIAPNKPDLKTLPLLKGDDNEFFIHYLCNLPQPESLQIIGELLKQNQSKQNSVREKIIWLSRYYDKLHNEETSPPVLSEI